MQLLGVDRGREQGLHELEIKSQNGRMGRKESSQEESKEGAAADDVDTEPGLDSQVMEFLSAHVELPPGSEKRHAEEDDDTEPELDRDMCKLPLELAC